MNSIWSITKLFWKWQRLFCLIFFAGLSVCIHAHTSDSLTMGEKYHRRVSRYRKAWNHIIPTYSKIQYAGGMGLLSIGMGWDYGKQSQWESEMFLGFIPRYSSDEGKATFTIKQNYIPWHKPLGKIVHIKPFTCSLYLNTIFNDEFWTQEPDRYPAGYYGFSTRVRINLSIGQRIQFCIPQQKRQFSKSISLYYEISVSDLYLISAVTNHLKPSDFLRLSFGIKSDIF